MRILTGDELRYYIENDSLIIENKYCHKKALELVLRLKEEIRIIQQPILLSGDRGNGKTTFMESCIKLLDDYNHIGYITLKEFDLLYKFDGDYDKYSEELGNQLKLLKQKGVKHIFIDEITILKNKYYYSDPLFADMLTTDFKDGLKMITGTNSLILRETILNNMNTQVRYNVLSLPRVYTYSDYKKVNKTLGYDDYLYSGGLLRNIDANDNTTYLPFLSSQHNLLLESVLYYNYYMLNLKLGNHQNTIATYNKYKLSVNLFLFILEIKLQHKTKMNYDEVIAGVESLEYFFDDFKTFCNVTNKISLLNDQLNKFVQTPSFGNIYELYGSYAALTETQLNFLFDYLLSEKVFNEILQAYLSPILQEYVYQIRNLVPGSQPLIYKPILKNLYLENILFPTKYTSNSKILFLKGKYFEMIVVELEKLSSGGFPLIYDIFTLSDNNNQPGFEIDLVNKYKGELIELKYRGNNTPNHLTKDYDKHLRDTSKINYYANLVGIPGLINYKKVVVYLGNSYKNENNVYYENFEERYKELDVLVPWDNNKLTKTQNNGLSWEDENDNP